MPNLRSFLAAVLMLVACPACTSAPYSSTGTLPAGAEPDASRPGAPLDALAPVPAGAERARLGAFVGTWSVAAEGVMTPGGALVPLGSGGATIEWVLGGVFLRWTITLEIAGVVHESVGYLGYDDTSGDFQSLWLSDLAGGMTLLSGRGDPTGAGLVVRGESRGATGVRKMRVVDEDTLLVEGFARNPAGALVLLRRSRYTRRAL